ncbi:MAG: septal ring lytic transglycosylase RlpA family protein [Pacificimonas sp.]
MALAALSACAGSPDRVRTASETGVVKIGKPYKIGGKTYYPKDDRDYREKGTASWYGPNFHGKPTANGERFDQNALSAAHRTLPLPSWVRVENLDNGREVTVRVNDRGPFAHNRMIDLSRRAAQLLDMQRAGVARVRVTRVYPDGTGGSVPEVRDAAPPLIVVAAADLSPAENVSDVMTADPPSESGNPSVTTVDVPAPKPASPELPAPATTGTIFVQVAAVSAMDRAVALAGALAGTGGIGPVFTETSPSGLVRVRVGPYSTLREAETMLAKLIAAGYEDARVVSGPIS